VSGRPPRPVRPERRGAPARARTPHMRIAQRLVSPVYATRAHCRVRDQTASPSPGRGHAQRHGPPCSWPTAPQHTDRRHDDPTASSHPQERWPCGLACGTIILQEPYPGWPGGLIERSKPVPLRGWFGLTLMLTVLPVLPAAATPRGIAPPHDMLLAALSPWPGSSCCWPATRSTLRGPSRPRPYPRLPPPRREHPQECAARRTAVAMATIMTTGYAVSVPSSTRPLSATKEPPRSYDPPTTPANARFALFHALAIKRAPPLFSLVAT